MHLPAEVLCEALQALAPAQLHCSKKEPIAGVRLDGSPVQEGYAYLLTGDRARTKQERRVLICIGEPAVPPERYILLPAETDPLQALCCLQDCFLSLAETEARFARAAAMNGYEPLLRRAEAYFHNNVILFDSANRVRAAARIDAHGSGASSFQSLQQLRQAGDLDYITGLREPTECRFPYFGASCVISNLFVEDQQVGRLLVICQNPVGSARLRFLCTILCQLLQDKIAGDPAFGYIRVDDPLYSMFYDLFTGLRLAPELVRDRLNALPGWEKGAFRVLYMNLENDAVSFAFYSAELRKRFDAFCVLQEHALLCLLHAEDEQSAWRMEPKLDALLREMERKAGLSNVFLRLEQLHDRAEQARTALRFSDGEALNVYAPKMLRHILTYFPREQRYLLIHPAIFRLMQIDQEQGTAYVETLKEFLRAERSPALAAQRLFIHRNTLLYRLEHLMELVTLDLDDPQLRLHLLLCFQMLESSSREENS